MLFERSLKMDSILACIFERASCHWRGKGYERFTTDLTSSAQAMYDATQGLLRFTVDSRRCREILRQWAATSKVNMSQWSRLKSQHIN